MADRIRVPKGSLAEAMLLPLYAQAHCAQKYPELFPDPGAIETMERVGNGFKKPRLKDLEILPDAIRRRIFADQIADFLERYPDACVVDLGAAYDTYFPTVDNGTCTWVNVDHQEVLDARSLLMAPHERQTDLGFGIFDPDWFDRVKALGHGPMLFIASDVFGRYQPQAVRLLVSSLADEFPGSVLVFDTVGSASKGRANKAAGKAGSSEVKFSLDEVASIRNWSDRIIDAQDVSAVPGDVMGSKALSLPVRLMLFSGGSAGITKVARLQFARK